MEGLGDKLGGVATRKRSFRTSERSGMLRRFILLGLRAISELSLATGDGADLRLRSSGNTSMLVTVIEVIGQRSLAGCEPNGIQLIKPGEQVKRDSKV
jgi:hypothetical protein